MHIRFIEIPPATSSRRPRRSLEAPDAAAAARRRDASRTGDLEIDEDFLRRIRDV